MIETAQDGRELAGKLDERGYEPPMIWPNQMEVMTNLTEPRSVTSGEKMQKEKRRLENIPPETNSGKSVEMSADTP